MSTCRINALIHASIVRMFCLRKWRADAFAGFNCDYALSANETQLAMA